MPCDAGNRLSQALFGHAGEDGGAEMGIATGIVEQHLARLPELQRGGIQVVDGAESFLASGTLGLNRQLGDQRIEHVEGVVQCGGLEDAGEGQQGGTRRSGGIRAMVAAQAVPA